MNRRQRASRRRLLVLGVVLGAVIIVWASVAQSRARDAGVRTAGEDLLLRLFTPPMRVAAGVRNAVTPDDPLPAPGELPPVGEARLQAVEAENRQLRALLALRDGLPAGAIAAGVIGRGDTPWQGSLILDKGTNDGIAPHMIVLCPAGVLGQIAAVSSTTAEVLLLTDRASGVGARIERSRATGVLKGYEKGRCRIEYLTSDSDVQIGDQVVTSGLGRVFPHDLGSLYPKGLPLGSVIDVQTDPARSAHNVTVQPAANPATVEWVVVVRGSGDQ